MTVPGAREGAPDPVLDPVPEPVPVLDPDPDPVPGDGHVPTVPEAVVVKVTGADVVLNPLKLTEESLMV